MSFLTSHSKTTSQTGGWTHTFIAPWFWTPENRPFLALFAFAHQWPRAPCLLLREFGHQRLQLLGLLVFLALFDLDGLPHQVSHSLLLRGIHHLATGTGWAHRTSVFLENTKINCTYIREMDEQTRADGQTSGVGQQLRKIHKTLRNAHMKYKRATT